MNLAIFDLDNTILEGDSDHAWGLYIRQFGDLDEAEFEKRANSFYTDYARGDLNLITYLDFVMSGLKSQPIDIIRTHRDNYIQSIVKPMIRKNILAIMQEHKTKGDKVIIITATNDFLVAPLKSVLPIDELIATNFEIDENGFTGKIIGTPSFREGKISRLDLWLNETGQKFETTYFYSDSSNDLPLLNVVDIPIAVTPDESLRSIALEKGWQIIE